MTDAYSNREIDRMFSEIQETLKRIEDQTTKTNGSVRGLQIWRARIIGGLAVSIIIVLPILGYLALQVEQLSAAK